MSVIPTSTVSTRPALTSAASSSNESQPTPRLVDRSFVNRPLRLFFDVSEFPFYRYQMGFVTLGRLAVTQCRASCPGGGDTV
jgi:hypothetical protein